jgi:hypothetical protein
MRRITYTLVAVVAASALAASTAAAQSADRYASPTSSLAGTTEKQDLRGEHAQDAARLAAKAQIARGEQTRHAFFLRRRPQGEQALVAATVKQDLRGEHAQDAARGIEPGTVPAKPPVYWSYDYQAAKPSPHTVSAPAPKPTDDNDLWLILAIALGATGIVAGSAFAVSHRSRVRVPA